MHHRDIVIHIDLVLEGRGQKFEGLGRNRISYEFRDGRHINWSESLEKRPSAKLKSEEEASEKDKDY